MPNINEILGKINPNNAGILRAISDELRRLQRFERMWIRVKQIRAEGCLLTSEDLEEIEKQALNDNHITT
jgi:hypothetical protein